MGPVAVHQKARLALEPILQRKLRVGAAHDPLEREADAIADQVLRMPDPAPALLQRCPGGCPGDEHVQRQAVEEPDEEEELTSRLSGALVQRCPGGCPGEDELRRQAMEEPDEEEEEVLQSKTGGAPVPLGDGTAAAISRRRGTGQPLPVDARRYFEPRFGVGLGGVRVHADTEAAGLARSVNARAFTVGADVFFGSGEWSPGVTSGRRLLAHELAHVVQQRGDQALVQRAVRSVTCTPGVDNAPADPQAAIDAIDAEAQRFAAAGEISFGLAAIDPTIFPSVEASYLTRFGFPTTVPPRRGGVLDRFRDRRSGRLHATQTDAMKAELDAISTRFGRLKAGLARPIRYSCNARAHTTGGCAFGRCGADTIATACTGVRRLRLCPGFWNAISDQQRAGALVHEMGHIALGLGHGSANFTQRFANAECYTSMVADTRGFVPFDVRCPPV